jgi:hypothetical protein
MKHLINSLLALLLILAVSCGGDDFKKTPIDQLIQKMEKEPVFTIVLQDMDVDGTFFKTYRHKYKIITEKDSTPKETTSDWYEVQKSFFQNHIDDLGMELASKTKDGKIHKDVGPAGFSNYVGNPQYGHWATGSNGSSFWEFYGKYAMMSQVFGMFQRPYYRSYYDDYRGSYWGTGRSYYGPNSTSGRTFGTSSPYTSSASGKSTWFSKSSNQRFSDKVRNRVSPSSSVSRSSSRFGSSSGSSSRSRGGGFGK